MTNAPATFQRLMEGVLHGLTGKCCLVYIDDIVIMGETFEEHLINLRAVLERLGQAKLKLKLKCRFAEAEVEYLGHVVSSKGLATDPRKVESVKNFPRPQDLRSVRSFLGLTSYYRRFIPCFSSIASPLYQLTKKDAPFDWTASCEQSFEQLKQRLIEAPVLVFPNFEKEFLLETDASGKEGSWCCARSGTV
ncbi:MAG: RNA-directed DNA polymerase [Proteobacteria bacterium]|nr:RNA-directed DNA polymerase [Pseudomonadota bacterium]